MVEVLADHEGNACIGFRDIVSIAHDIAAIAREETLTRIITA